MHSNGNNFNWNPARSDSVNQIVHDVSKDMRRIRPLMDPPYGQWKDYVGSIPGHKLNPVILGSPLSIEPNQNLSPVKIWCEFRLREEQFDDEDTVNTLAVEAAYRVAQAEDAVILLGAQAEAFLAGLNVQREQLDKQEGLFQANPPPLDEPRDRPQYITESIIQGIKELQRKGRYDRYAAIVDLELYEEAIRPRQRAFDAQIYEIRLLLGEDRFLYCPAAPRRSGVIFSLSGDGIKLAVPLDAMVQMVEEKRDVTLRVVEQIRLLVDVPEAVVALANPLPPGGSPAPVAPGANPSTRNRSARNRRAG